MGRRPPLAKFTSAIHLSLVQCHVGTRRVLSGISLQLCTIIQQHRFINTIAPLIQQPSHYPQKIQYFCHCQGFFLFAIPSSQISAQNLVCRLHSLGYHAQVLHPELLHRPDTIIGFSITLPDGSVWVTEPSDPTDFLFSPSEGWRIGSVLIVVWD